ncbi:unnamed protein product [Orchesella dallaii]|uniref:CB1 cannabinoid receptor-interacting protein 1 n=1 Tax=Orchesella dallaii TaxID=48710 RepID=A0ABP1S8X9_9HEXA
MSSGNSSGSASFFKVTLSIRKDGESLPAYMKQDGQRFKLPRTLKLAVDTTYRVDLSFKPPQILTNLQVQNQEVPCQEKARDSTASAYSGMYLTHNIPVSKNGVRHDIPIAMQIGDKGELIVSLQVKFYKCQDPNHSEWGSSLHCIEYECSHVPGASRVIVTKETYSESVSGSSFSLRTCATLHSQDNGFQEQSLIIEDGNVIGNTGEEYATASQSWNTSSGYWNVSSGCELTACQDIYLASTCSLFGGSNPSTTPSNRWLSANCKCNKECKCSEIKWQNNICARAYLHANGCNTCDASYTELEDSNPMFSEEFGDKISSLLVRPGCRITFFEEEDFETELEAVDGSSSLQTWSGKIGSYECDCSDVEDDDDNDLDEDTILEDSSSEGEEFPDQLTIPDSLDDIVRELQQRNYSHPGLLAAFSSLTHGRSPKTAYILLIGSSGAGKSSAINLLLNNPEVTLAGDHASTTSDILEFRIPTPLDKMGLSNTELRMIDTPGLGDTRGIKHDAVFLATLDDYLSDHEELNERIPNLVLVFHHFSDNRYSGTGAKFVSMLRGLNNFRTKITDENYSNVLFVFSHFCTEISKLQSNPSPKLLRFKEVIEEFSFFPKPILTSVMEIDGKGNDLLKVNENYVLPNKEHFPSNLLNKFDAITMKGKDDLGRAIINEALRNRKQHSNVSETIFVMENSEHPKTAKYLSTLSAALLDFSKSEISLSLQQAYNRMPPRLRRAIGNGLENLKIYLNKKKILTKNDVPKTLGEILDLLEEVEKSEAVLYLLENGLDLKIPAFPKSAVVTSSSFSSITDSVLPISPYKLEVLKTSEIGFKIPEAIDCKKESETVNLLNLFNTTEQYVRHQLVQKFDVDVSILNNTQIFYGLHNNIQEGFFIKESSCSETVCNFVASKFYKMFQFDFKENAVLTPDFGRRVRSLAPFNAKNYNNVELWNNFFNDYGTHVVKSAWGGGRIDIHVRSPPQISVESLKTKLFQNLEYADDLTTLISNKIDPKRILPLGVTISLVFHGGTPSFHTSDLTALGLEEASKMMRNWKASLKYNPVLLPVEMISIHKVAKRVAAGKAEHIRKTLLLLENGALSIHSTTHINQINANLLKAEIARQQREADKRKRELEAEARRLEVQAKRERQAALAEQRKMEVERKRQEAQRNRLEAKQKRDELHLERRREAERQRLVRERLQNTRRAEAEEKLRQWEHQRQLFLISKRNVKQAFKIGERAKRRKENEEKRLQRQLDDALRRARELGMEYSGLGI